MQTIFAPRPSAADFPLPGLHRPSARTLAARPPALAVIVPTLNEHDNVAPILAQLEDALADRAWEVIFVDDGSVDGTPEAIEALAAARSNVRLIRRHGRRGLSSAILEGMLATIAPVTAVIDADLQHDASLLPRLADAIGAGADIAVGTRYGASGSIGDWDRSRAKVSALGTRLARLVSAAPCSDPLSGFFAVRRALVIDALPRLSAVGFKLLLDLLASSPASIKVAELPYRFGSRHAGESKLDAMVGVEYALLLVDKLVGRWIPARLVLFMGVGALGLIVNLLALGFGLDIRLPFATAQLAAVLLSILFNYTLNNLLTYRDRRLAGWRWWRGLATYGLVCGLGAAAQVNVATRVFGEERIWWLAGMAGAAVGAVWNYAASSAVTWRKR